MDEKDFQILRESLNIAWHDAQFELLYYTLEVALDEIEDAGFAVLLKLCISPVKQLDNQALLKLLTIDILDQGFQAAHMVPELRENAIPEIILMLAQCIYTQNPELDNILPFLTLYPNINPYNIADLVLFEQALDSYQKESHKTLPVEIRQQLLRLREAYLEMTPLKEMHYAEDTLEKTVYYRDGKIPFGLNKYADPKKHPIKPGDIQACTKAFVDKRIAQYEQHQERIKQEQAERDLLYEEQLKEAQRLKEERIKARRLQLELEEQARQKQPAEKAAANSSLITNLISKAWAFPRLSLITPTVFLTTQQAIEHGSKLYKLKYYKGALSCFKSALEKEPDNYTAKLKYADTLRALQRHKEALEIYANLDNDEASNIKLLNRMADCLYTLGKGYYRHALGIYNRILRLDPQNIQVLTDRACTFFKLGLFEQALKSFNDALLDYPENADLLYNRALTLCNQKLFDEAEIDFIKALEYQPDNSTIWTDYGLLCIKLGEDRFSNAEQHLKKALKLDSKNAKALSYLGLGLNSLFPI